MNSNNSRRNSSYTTITKLHNITPNAAKLQQHQINNRSSNLIKRRSSGKSSYNNGSRGNSNNTALYLLDIGAYLVVCQESLSSGELARLTLLTGWRVEAMVLQPGWTGSE